MANTQAMCTSFKTDLLNGIHAFGTTVVRGATTADSFKVALYVATATMDSTATAYTATNEVSGSGYTAGGISAGTFNAPAATGTTAYTTPTASWSFGTVTLATSFDAALLYNSTQSNKAVSVHTFGATTVSAGAFTLTMPTNDSTNGLLRIA